MIINNFTTIESIYGRFIVNRHCSHQAEHLIKTGVPHIHDELRKILAIVATLPAQAVVVDAGANIGLVSVPIAQALKEKQGTVYAFEVQRMLFNALCGSAALNDLDNLKVFHRGLGSRKEILKVPSPNYSKPQDFGIVSLVDQAAIKDGDIVDIMTIDSLKLPRLDFLKIDVEGMEIDVLKGARQSLRSFHPWCWIEYWRSDKDLLRSQFDGLGYKLYLMDELNIVAIPEEKFVELPLHLSAPLF